MYVPFTITQFHCKGVLQYCTVVNDALFCRFTLKRHCVTFSPQRDVDPSRVSVLLRPQLHIYGSTDNSSGTFGRKNRSYKTMFILVYFVQDNSARVKCRAGVANRENFPMGWSG